MPTLEFKGKQFIYTHHLSVPFRTLEIDTAKSLPGDGGPNLDDNLIIHGDNLHALKALLPTYAGKVKCIYIDPPYNTGNEKWCYNDRVNAPLMREWLKKEANPVDKEDLERHDKWLSMMWPRLQLLNELLSDDGVIFISIGDDEFHNLRSIANEIFGEANSIATIIWEKGKKGDVKRISINHDYILIYVKNLSAHPANKKWRQRKPGIDAVLAYYDSLRSEYGSNHSKIREEMMKWYRSLKREDVRKKHKHYNWSDERGLYFPDNFAGPDDGRESRPRYDIIHPITGKPCAKPATGWRWDEETTKEAMEDNPPRVHFGPDETTIPNRKSYLFEISEEPFPSVIYKDGRAGSKELEQIMGRGSFSFPKDASVIADIISLVAGPEDIILDSFAGSGTTAQAVLAMNKEDAGNRKFILVEMEDYADQLTAERVRRVTRGVPKAKEEALKEGLGGSFTFCTLGEEINISSLLKGESLPSYETLARYVFYTATGKTLGDLPKRRPDWLIGETDVYRVHLIYQPDREFLRSPESALNAEMVDILAGGKGQKAPKKSLVFAAVKFMGQKELTERNIEFCQLPYAIHRFLGD